MTVTNLETSGSGTAAYGGLGNVVANAGSVSTDTSTLRNRVGEIGDLGNELRNYEDEDRDNIGLNASYQFNPSLRSNNNISRQDIIYLTQVLEMRLRHEGCQVVDPSSADVLLIVLVDVLGTNLSRMDFLLAYKDDLGASCEITYYGNRS